MHQRPFLWFLVLGLTVLLATADDSSPEALVKAGHWKRARAAVQKVAETTPKDPEICFLLSQVKLAFGDLDAALELAQKAVALNDKQARYHVQLGEVYGEMAQRASIFKKMGLARQFKKEEEVAAALDSKNLDARFDLLEFDLRAPGIIGGGKDKASAMAEEIARINEAKGDIARAMIAGIEKDRAKQESFCEKALKSDPHDYDSLITIAIFYASDAEKKYDLAERHAREALKLDAGRGRAYSVLSGVYTAQQRWKELDEILAELEKNDSDNLFSYFQAGRILLVNGQDFPRAERYFRKYLTQEPEPGAPPVARAHWRLGEVLEKEGRKPEAINELETALRLQHDFPEAKKDLERLK